MERFFYRSESERNRIRLIQLELGKVGALINRYEKQRTGYDVPKHFEVGWIFFTAGDGNAIEEKLIRRTYTTVQVMERVLYKQIKSLKKLQSIHKNK